MTRANLTFAVGLAVLLFGVVLAYSSWPASLTPYWRAIGGVGLAMAGWGRFSQARLKRDAEIDTAISEAGSDAGSGDDAR